MYAETAMDPGQDQRQRLHNCIGRAADPRRHNDKRIAVANTEFFPKRLQRAGLELMLWILQITQRLGRRRPSNKTK